MTVKLWSVTTESEQALAAATRETVLQLRVGSTLRAEILAWGVSFDGTDATAAPVVVDFEFQSTDGTSGTALTEINMDQSSPDTAADVTAHTNFSASGISAGRIEQHEVHPQGGNLIREYPPDARPVVENSRIAITVTAPAIVNVVAWIHWAE